METPFLTKNRISLSTQNDKNFIFYEISKFFFQLGLSEFHLIHTLTGVPVKESLAAEHAGVVLSDALEHFLDGGGVAEEGDGHLQTLGGDI